MANFLRSALFSDIYLRSSLVDPNPFHPPVMPVVEIDESEASIEQQIHNDVYSAQELLLEEAKAVLEFAPVQDEIKNKRMAKLSELGFFNAEEVKSFNTTHRQISHQKWLKELIEGYKARYPFNKFIDSKSVDTVCEKYGLLIGTPSEYIAEIPEKNQIEIADFMVFMKDLDVDKRLNAKGFEYRNPLSFSWIVRENTIIVEDFTEWHNLIDHELKTDAGTEKTTPIGLQIVAPPSKFDMREKRVEGNRIVRDIKDPIVLQPVIGGYLIVSSWGLEAADPLVVNEINN